MTSMNTYLIPSFKKYNILTFDVFFGFYHIKWYALVLSQCLKKTQGMDLDSTCFFSNLKCEHRFCNKRLSNENIEFPTFDPCFLWVFWITSFGWTSIFDLNHYVQYFCPKLQVKFLHKNHAFSTLHNCSIGFIHNPILLWWIWNTYLLLDPNSPRRHQTFWKQFFN